MNFGDRIFSFFMLCAHDVKRPNAKLTDDEERASDAAIGTCG
jgi:hypothetical protein